VAQFDLNLSTRPFPPYRRINIALIAILIVFIAISIWQAVGFMRFSSMAAEIRPAEEQARVEAEALGARVAELGSRLDRPEAAAKLNEIGFLNQLIARKNLSWTQLFAHLEDMVPDSVHLVTLTPSIGMDGTITLRLTLQGKSTDDVSEFVERLEGSPVFDNIAVATEQRRDNSEDVNLALTTDYYPQRDIQ
jgi:Tfp pilus assembly protein PilN